MHVEAQRIGLKRNYSDCCNRLRYGKAEQDTLFMTKTNQPTSNNNNKNNNNNSIKINDRIGLTALISDDASSTQKTNSHVKEDYPQRQFKNHETSHSTWVLLLLFLFWILFFSLVVFLFLHPIFFFACL